MDLGQRLLPDEIEKIESALTRFDYLKTRGIVRLTDLVEVLEIVKIRRDPKSIVAESLDQFIDQLRKYDELGRGGLLNMLAYHKKLNADSQSQDIATHLEREGVCDASSEVEQLRAERDAAINIALNERERIARYFDGSGFAAKALANGIRAIPAPVFPEARVHRAVIQSHSAAVAETAHAAGVQTGMEQEHGAGVCTPPNEVSAHHPPEPSPQPAIPVAGWVVRWGQPGFYRFSQGIGIDIGDSSIAGARVYTDKAEADRDAATVEHKVAVLPVDADGAVIEERAKPPVPTPWNRWLADALRHQANVDDGSGTTGPRQEASTRFAKFCRHLADKVISEGTGAFDWPPTPSELEVERLTRERDAALALARRCREVALGERERLAGALERDVAQFAAAYDVPGDVTPAWVRRLPAPTLPEVP